MHLVYAQIDDQLLLSMLASIHTFNLYFWAQNGYLWGWGKKNKNTHTAEQLLFSSLQF